MRQRRMWRFRWLACLYALTHGYFWRPCPNCGRMFGGHERGEALWRGWHLCEMTCSDPTCAEEVKRQNAAVVKANPPPSVRVNLPPAPTTSPAWWQP